MAGVEVHQLIMHAALCDHCGPLLRAATSVDDDPTPEEEILLAELKAPSRPGLATRDCAACLHRLAAVLHGRC